MSTKEQITAQPIPPADMDATIQPKVSQYPSTVIGTNHCTQIYPRPREENEPASPDPVYTSSPDASMIPVEVPTTTSAVNTTNTTPTSSSTTTSPPNPPSPTLSISTVSTLTTLPPHFDIDETLTPLLTRTRHHFRPSATHAQQRETYNAITRLEPRQQDVLAGTGDVLGYLLGGEIPLERKVELMCVYTAFEDSMRRGSGQGKGGDGK